MTKEYVAKAQVRPRLPLFFRFLQRRELTSTMTREQGFWGDVKGYYSEPPMLITIDHLSGNQTALIQKMKILLMAA